MGVYKEDVVQKFSIYPTLIIFVIMLVIFGAGCILLKSLSQKNKEIKGNNVPVVRKPRNTQRIDGREDLLKRRKTIENFIFGCFCFCWLVTIFTLIYELRTNKNLFNIPKIATERWFSFGDAQTLLFMLAVALPFIFIILTLIRLSLSFTILSGILAPPIIFIMFVRSMKFYVAIGGSAFWLIFIVYIYFNYAKDIVAYLNAMTSASNKMLENISILFLILFLHLIATALCLTMLYPLFIGNNVNIVLKITSFVLFIWTFNTICFMCRMRILEECIDGSLAPKIADNPTGILIKCCRMAVLPTSISTLISLIKLVFKSIKKVDKVALGNNAEKVVETVAIAITCWASFIKINSLFSNDIEIIEIIKYGAEETDTLLIEEMGTYPEFKTKTKRSFLFSLLALLQVFVFSFYYATNFIRYLVSISGGLIYDFSMAHFAAYLKENASGGFSLFNIRSISFSDTFSSKSVILLFGYIAVYSCIYIIMHSLFDIIISIKADIAVKKRLELKKLGNR